MRGLTPFTPFQFCKKMKSFLPVAVFLLSILGGHASDPIRDKAEKRMKQMIKNSMAISLPLYLFNERYPQNEIFVSYMDGISGETKVNAYTVINKRYILSLILPIKVSGGEDRRVLFVGQPAGQIKEILNIQLDQQGRLKSNDYGTIINLGAEEVGRILIDKVAISEFGVSLEKEATIPDGIDYFRL